MKFVKNTKDFDFDEEERKQKKQDKDKFTAEWAERLVECANEDIPIISKLKRGAARKKVNFDTYTNVVDDMQMIFENNQWMFNSRREADRAAHYIGRGILKAVLGREKREWTSSAESKFYDSIRRFLESDHVDVGIMALFVDAIFQKYEAFKTGVIGEVKLDEDLSAMAREMPGHLRKLAHLKIGQMRAGTKISNLYEHITHGGKRSKSAEG